MCSDWLYFSLRGGIFYVIPSGYSRETKTKAENTMKTITPIASMLRFLPLVLSVALLMLLPSCGTSTRTTVASSWADEKLAGKTFSKILVVGIAENRRPRMLFEQTLKKELEDKGVAAMSALEVMPVEEKVSREAFEKYFGSMGFDGVIVTSVIEVADRDQVSHGTSAQMYMDPSSAQGSFYQYYLSAYNRVHYPPEVTLQNVVVVETNLYETQNGKAVWASISETIEPKGIEDTVNSLTASIIKQLSEKGYVRR
jgi:hypothetical protein